MKQYYTVNTSPVKKVLQLNSEYFYQMGFQHNIVTISWLVENSTLRRQRANRPLFNLTN